MRTWALGLCALSCGATPEPMSVCGPTTATVSRVVDGDTLELQGGERVRLLLVDTPETTGGKMDCYGAEAVRFTTERATGKTVKLAYDEASCRDRYGRLLAYATIDGVELNRALAEQGYACFLYISPGGMARREEFETYEIQAKTARTGMWGQCTKVTCD